MPEEQPIIEPLPFRVREADDTWLDTQVNVPTNCRVIITASGSIWAGVAFTGRNGPFGWEGWRAPDDYPLGGAPPFSLIGNLNGQIFYIGESYQFVHRAGPGTLFLRINDNVAGNGDGSFVAVIEVWQQR